jgi:hypothetical protein
MSIAPQAGQRTGGFGSPVLDSGFMEIIPSSSRDRSRQNRH